jgi:hypothetical protein
MAANGRTKSERGELRKAPAYVELTRYFGLLATDAFYDETVAAAQNSQLRMSFETSDGDGAVVITSGAEDNTVCTVTMAGSRVQRCDCYVYCSMGISFRHIMAVIQQSLSDGAHGTNELTELARLFNVRRRLNTGFS